MTITSTDFKPFGQPQVTVSFVAAVSLPKARLGYPPMDFLAPPKRKTVAEIQKVVADYYHLSPLELISDRRARYVARPRQVAMWVTKQITTRSLPDIGRRFGNRDHTTVLHAVRRIKALIETDAAIRRDCRALLDQLGGIPA